jgi:hypothetical protein
MQTSEQEHEGQEGQHPVQAYAFIKRQQKKQYEWHDKEGCQTPVITPVFDFYDLPGSPGRDQINHHRHIDTKVLEGEMGTLISVNQIEQKIIPAMGGIPREIE